MSSRLTFSPAIVSGLAVSVMATSCDWVFESLWVVGCSSVWVGGDSISGDIECGIPNENIQTVEVVLVWLSLCSISVECLITHSAGSCSGGFPRRDFQGWDDATRSHYFPIGIGSGSVVVTSTFDDIAKHKPPVGAATTIIVIVPLKTAGHGLHRAVLHHFIMSEEGEMVAGDDYISDESSFYGMSRISHICTQSRDFRCPERAEPWNCRNGPKICHSSNKAFGALRHAYCVPTHHWSTGTSRYEVKPDT